MDYLAIFALFLANAGLILWMRSESRQDWRHMDQKFDAFREDMKAEMKDFHGRLVALEEKYINWLMRNK